MSNELNDLQKKIRELESKSEHQLQEINELKFKNTAIIMLFNYLKDEEGGILDNVIKKVDYLRRYAKGYAVDECRDVERLVIKGNNILDIGLELAQSINTYGEFNIKQAIQSLPDVYDNINIHYPYADEDYRINAPETWLNIGLRTILRNINERFKKSKSKELINVWIKNEKARLGDEDYYWLSISHNGPVLKEAEDFSKFDPYLINAAPNKPLKRIKKRSLNNKLELFKLGLSCLGGDFEIIRIENQESINIYIPKK